MGVDVILVWFGAGSWHPREALKETCSHVGKPGRVFFARGLRLRVGLEWLQPARAYLVSARGDSRACPMASREPGRKASPDQCRGNGQDRRRRRDEPSSSSMPKTCKRTDESIKHAHTHTSDRGAGFAKRRRRLETKDAHIQRSKCK